MGSNKHCRTWPSALCGTFLWILLVGLCAGLARSACEFWSIDEYGWVLSIVGIVAAVSAARGAADILLSLKHGPIERWWIESADEHRRLSERLGHAPRTDSKDRVEAACAIWAADVRRLAAGGGLTQRQLLLARRANLDIADAQVVTDEPDFGLSNLKWPYLACLVTIAASVALSLLCPDSRAATSLCVMGALCSVAIVVDVRSRIIPIEISALIALVGLTYQFFAISPSAAALALAAALLVVICLKVAQRIAARLGHGDGLGAGDVRTMAAVICASGASGALAGALAFAVSFLSWFAVAALAGKANLRTKVPMAPFLAVWALVGMATCAGFPALA